MLLPFPGGLLMRVFLVFCLLPAILFAQTYYEASGQTVPFTLTPGGKAGWMAVGKHVYVRSLPAAPAISVYPNPSRGEIGLQVLGYREGMSATLCDVQGKRLEGLDFSGSGAAEVRRVLPTAFISFFCRRTSGPSGKPVF
jgi:hypothetical protein